jgi:NurA-like 5'-3' nuclease
MSDLNLQMDMLAQRYASLTAEYNESLAEIQRLNKANFELRTTNAELVEALEYIAQFHSHDTFLQKVFNSARQALAKHGGSK